MCRPLKRGATLPLLAAALISLAAAGAAPAADRDDDQGWLGITMAEISRSLAREMDLDSRDGVLVLDVVEDSPAEEAGLREDDVIVSFDGHELEDTEDLSYWIGKAAPGDEVELKVIRDSEERTIEVTLGKRERGDRTFRWLGRGDGDDRDVYIVRRGDGDDDLHFQFFGGPRAWLGVGLQDLNEQLGDYFGVEDGKGALVSEVFEDGPAAEAGIKAGDVIVELDGDEVEDAADVHDVLREAEDGDEVEVKVQRDRGTKTFTVTLAEAPDDLAGMELGKLRWFDGQDLSSPRVWRLPEDLPRLQAQPRPKLPSEIFGNRDEMDELREQLRELRQELRELKEELRGDG